MNVEALIAAKKTERRNKGLHVRVEFENREPFNTYPNSVERRDAVVAHFIAKIGKADETGDIVTAVHVVQ